MYQAYTPVSVLQFRRCLLESCFIYVIFFKFLLVKYLTRSMSDSMDGEVIDWHEEARAVIHDVGFALKAISISTSLPSSQTEIYFNIETREGKKLCVELSSYGFKVVGDSFDKVTEGFHDQTYYETPYALLDKYSNQFRECFAAALEKKLSCLTDLS